MPSLPAYKVVQQKMSFSLKKDNKENDYENELVFGNNEILSISKIIEMFVERANYIGNSITIKISGIDITIDPCDELEKDTYTLNLKKIYYAKMMEVFNFERSLTAAKWWTDKLNIPNYPSQELDKKEEQDDFLSEYYEEEQKTLIKFLDSKPIISNEQKQAFQNSLCDKIFEILQAGNIQYKLNTIVYLICPVLQECASEVGISKFCFPHNSTLTINNNGVQVLCGTGKLVSIYKNERFLSFKNKVELEIEQEKERQRKNNQQQICFDYSQPKLVI